MANIEITKKDKSAKAMKPHYCLQNRRLSKLWIAWEKHRRTTELAAALGDVKVYQLEFNAPRLIRYLYLLYKYLSIKQSA